MVKKILFLVLLSFLLTPAEAMAQTEYPINVKLECSGSYPVDKEYSFKFVNWGVFSTYEAPKYSPKTAENPEWLRCEAPETFTLKANEAKEIGRIVVDQPKVPSEGDSLNYCFSLYQTGIPGPDTSGAFFDPTEFRQCLKITANRNEVGIELNRSYTVDTLPGLHENDGEEVIFHNRFFQPESTSLEIETLGDHSSFPKNELIPCTVCFWNEDGLIKDEFPLSGADDRTGIRTGEKYVFHPDKKYIISELPKGTHYCLWPEYSNPNDDQVNFINQLDVINACGTIPNSAFLDYNSPLDFNTNIDSEMGLYSKETIQITGMNPDEIYRIDFTPENGLTGDSFDSVIYFPGSLKNVPVPHLRQAVYGDSHQYSYWGDRNWITIIREKWSVKVEPANGHSVSPAFLFSCNSGVEYESGSEYFSSDCYSDAFLLAVIPKIKGVKTENGETPSRNYGFEIKPVKAETEVVRSFEADNNLLFIFLGENIGKYREIRFSDEKVPNGVEPKDCSKLQDGSVMTWLKDDVFYISTCENGRKVVFRDFSLNFQSLESREGEINVDKLDVSMMKPIGKLNFSNFTGSEIKGIASLDTSEVTDMSNLFRGCAHLISVDGINSWDTSNVTSLESAFQDCRMLEEISVPNWDVSHVKNFSKAFCMTYVQDNLKEIDLSYWNPISAEDVSEMFYSCSSLKFIYGGSWSKVREISGTKGADVFKDSKELTGYSSSKIEAEYCKSVSEDGYFSDPKGSPEVGRNPIYIPEPSKTSETLTAEDMPVPSLGETVQNKEGLISWGYLYFEDEGDYTYEVSEVNDDQDGVTYDPKKYTVTFHVTEDETKGDTYSRPLKTEIEVSPGGEIAFNNTVKTGVAFEIPVEKRFVNQPEGFDGSFTYKLEPDTLTKLKEGYELPGEAPLSVSAKPGEPISFGEISFTEPGSYGFTMSEDSSEALEDIIYDESVWTVTVTVVNGESGLEITDVSYADSVPDEGMEDTVYADMLKDLEQKKQEAEAQRELNEDSAEFINTYTPPEWQYRKAVFINTYLKPAVYAPKVNKAFESNVITPEAPFTFTLTPTGENPEEGLVMPEQTTVVISGSGIKNFDNVTFRKAGTYHFTIQETEGAVPGVGYDKQACNLTVEVTDPKNDGNLEISSVNYEKAAALAFAPAFQPFSLFRS